MDDKLIKEKSWAGRQELDVYVDCRGPALLSALMSYKN